MSFFRYLRDNIRFIILYFFLASFFALMAYLDANFRMGQNNTYYTVAVSFLIYIVVVFIDYRIRLKQLKRIARSKTGNDYVPLLPEPRDNKDELYTEFIQGLYNQYMDAIRRMEDEYREDREFMIAWVHEVKMPITAARLLAESAKEEEESIKEEIERINEYVEKVLYYSRSDSFSKDYIIGEENLNKLVRENIKKHSAVFIKKQISVALDIDNSLTVYTDRKWLLFIMDQLLSNALKYTGEKGSIKVYTIKNSDTITLNYEDNGRGIKKDDMGRLFAKSFTGQNGRKPGSGATGLGLYLAQKLANKLNHRISISSEYGRGTTASIHFPIIDDDITRM